MSLLKQASSFVAVRPHAAYYRPWWERVCEAVFRRVMGAYQVEG
jgi:hypothetical protein